MTYIGWLRLLSTIGLVLSVAFLARYSVGARWARTAVGKHMWCFSLLNAEFFGLFCWSLWIGPKLPYEQALTVGFIAQFVALVAWRWWLFEVEQRRGVHERLLRMKGDQP